MKNSRITVASLVAVAALVFLAGVVAIAPPALASKGMVQFTDANGTPMNYWRVGDTVYVTVFDVDENRNLEEAELLGGVGSNGNPVVEVTVGWQGRTDREVLTLQETGANTGVFRSQTGLRVANAAGTGAPNNGVLEVMNGDTVLVRYQDPTDPTDLSTDLAKIERVAAKISITDRAGNPIALTDVGRMVYVTVEDADENTDPMTAEEIQGVTLHNPRLGGSVTLTLVETEPNSGVFRNAEGVVLYDAKGPQTTTGLRVDDKDTIVAYYRLPAGVGIVPPPTDGCRTENDMIRFERTLPAVVNPGDTFTVRVTVTAKRAVRALIVSDDVGGLTALDPTRAGSITPLQPNQSFTFTYRVRAGSTVGAFRISGMATAITDSTTQPPLTLNCPLRVGAATASPALASSRSSRLLRALADVNSSDVIEFKREAPAQAAVGQTFAVRVTITAKRAVRALIVSDDVGDLTALDPTRAGSITPLQPNQSFTFTYRVQCPAAGSYSIVGRATPITDSTTGTPVSVSTTVLCGVTAPPPTPVSASLGDMNDPSDYALVMAKVAEPNPGTVEFTDVNGRALSEFRIGGEAFVTVKDRDANSHSDRVNTVTVNVFAPSSGGRETLTLVETGVNTGAFRNAKGLKLVAAGGTDAADDGQLAVYHGHMIYVEYRDIQQTGDVTQRKDDFDITYAMASIYSTRVFSVTAAGSRTLRISFTNDAMQNVEEYKIGEDVFVKVEDPDNNHSKDQVDTLKVTVIDRDTNDTETITLTETGPDTGVFFSKQGLPLRRPGQPSGCASVCPDDGALQMEDRDLIEAHYQDANDPMDYAVAVANIIPVHPIIENKVSSIAITNAAGQPIEIAATTPAFYVKVTDPDEVTTTRVTATVTHSRGGLVLQTLPVELSGSAGNFMSQAITLGPAGSGMMLEIQEGDEIKAEYVDPNFPADRASVTKIVRAVVIDVFKCERVETMAVGGRITFTAIGTGIANTQVWVYDLNGQLVWSSSRAGTAVEWNGMSLGGARAANGVYLYVVICKGSKANEVKNLGVKKLVILN